MARLSIFYKKSGQKQRDLAENDLILILILKKRLRGGYANDVMHVLTSCIYLNYCNCIYVQSIHLCMIK